MSGAVPLRPQSFRVADHDVDPGTCTLTRDDVVVKLEPKVMELLVLLASRPGQVFSRGEIEAVVWPGVTVTEDSVTRAVMKLRRALSDTAERPTHIQTVPKRGYALIAPVQEIAAQGTAGSSHSRPVWASIPAMAGAAAVLLVLALIVVVLPRDLAPSEDDALVRAKAYYVQFTREDNEAAIALFERALLADADNVEAHSGLANALMQRVLRWPNAPGEPATPSPGLGPALASGRIDPDNADIARARRLAERAVSLAPSNAEALTALGLALSGQGELEAARQSYQAAVMADSRAWRAQVNLAELALIDGDQDAALAAFEAGYTAALAAAQASPQAVGDWPLHIAMTVGAHYEAMGMPHLAADWYRRVLEDKPLHTGATLQLVRLLRDAGQTREADALCEGLTTRVGVFEACQG